MDFCKICKRSNTLGKRHFYTRLHQQNLSNYLEKILDGYEKLKKLLTPNTCFLTCISQQPHLYCVFCELDLFANEKYLKDSLNAAGWEDITSGKFDFLFRRLHIFYHLSTTSHQKNVVAWLRKFHGPSHWVEKLVLKNSDYKQVTFWKFEPTTDFLNL